MPEPIPTDRELEALKILWDRGRATVREMWRQLRRHHEELAYTTVLSLLQTMEQKGLVGHESVGRAYAYFPKVERESTLRNLAGRFLDRVFNGAMDEYLVHALRSRRPSPQELDQLEKMIFEAKRRSQRRPTQGGRP